MAVTTHTISGNVGDLINDDFDPDLVVAKIESNVPSGGILVAGTTIRLGDKAVTVDSTGAFSQTGFVASDSADTNVDPDTPLQYRLVVNYSRSSDGKRIIAYGSWFELTADTNVATAQETAYLPASFVSEVTAQMLDYLAEAAQAVIDAGAAADGFGIGTVTTGAAGSSAAATITGTAPNKQLNLTIPRGNTGATGATGAQGLPGPGSAAWTASQAVAVGSVRQSPTGEYIRSTSARTTGATYDATEAGFWTFVHIPTALTANPVGSTTEIRTVTGPRSTKWRESFARGNVTEGATTLENMTWGWGFNMTTSYGKEVSTEPMLRIGMETSWLNGGVVRSEMHLGAFIDPASAGTEIRPISMDIRHGGDSGKGSPGIAFTISETDAAAGMSINSVAGASLFRLSTTGFTFNRTTAVQRGSSAASTLIVGDHLHDAVLQLDAKGSGKSNQISLQREGVSSWLWYDAASTNEFYFRDTTNSHNHMYFLKGATDEAARTDIYSLVRIKGSETQFGPSGQVKVGTLGTVEGWVDSTTTLNLRSQAGSGIVSLSKHTFNGNVGFYGTTPIAKQTLSGSRAGNAALASAISALASLGLVTDATTA